MLLEGLQSYFQSLGGNSRDRIMRAQLLSRASRNQELTALTSAWLAHIQFQEGSIGAAIESIHVAVGAIEVGHWAALGRISSVLADVFLTVGDAELARRWYAHARHAAVQYGDQAALGAITYNQSALRLFDLRLIQAIGSTIDLQTLQLAESEGKSALNYQIASGVTSLGHLLTGVQVSVEMLKSRYDEALPLLSSLLLDEELPQSYQYRSVLLSDAVLCCAALGLISDAKKYWSQLVAQDLEILPLDDRIIVISNLNRGVECAPEVFEGSYAVRSIGDLALELSKQRANFIESLTLFSDIPQALRW